MYTILEQLKIQDIMVVSNKTNIQISHRASLDENSFYFVRAGPHFRLLTTRKSCLVGMRMQH